MTTGESGRAPADAYVGVPVLVLGAAGFIGAWVTRALVDAGANVHAVVRDKRAADRAFARFVPTAVVEADLAVPGRPSAVIAAAGPAVVFNLAGYGVDRGERDSARMHALNAQLVSEVCASLADVGATSRLVHVGSALEYGTLGDGKDERARPQPTTDYGRTKLMGTRAVAQAAADRDLNGLTVRLFNVYGPGEPPDRLLPSIFGAASRHDVVHLTTGRQQRDFSYVEDVAEGLLRLGVSRIMPGEVVHLASGRLTTVRTFAESAAAVAGIDLSRMAFGALSDNPDEVRHGVVSIARLQAVTAWRPPTTVADGIRRAWESGYGW